jgi:hypothetical protein
MDVCGIFGLEPEEKKEKKKKLPKILEVPKSLKVMKHVKTRLPNPKCALCPLGHSEEFPLVGTDSNGVFCHVECGAFVHETWTEIIKPVEPNAEVKLAENGTQEVHNDIVIQGEVEDTVLGLISLSNSGPDNINDSKENGEPALKKVRISDDSSVQEDILMESVVEPIATTSVAETKEPDQIPLAGELFRVNGISHIPLDRWKLKCSVCQYTGPPLKKLGACIQCTVGKCTRSYHVTCGLMAGIFMDLSETGALTSYCSTHDPVLKQQKKLEKENSINQKDQSKIFTVGTTVIVKYGGVKYEGIVLNVVKDKRGCEVQFEEQEEACFASWESLKVKEVKEVKVKPIVDYSDTKRKKKNDMLSLLTLFDVSVEAKSDFIVGEVDKHAQSSTVEVQTNVDNADNSSDQITSSEMESLDSIDESLSTGDNLESNETMVLAGCPIEASIEKGPQDYSSQPLEK